MSKDHEYLYPYSAQEAKKRNQLSMWRESYHANIACRNAIEKTIRQNFDGMHLKKDCLEPVLAEYGYKRTEWVLATTLQELSWDGRFSRTNKQWAMRRYIPQDERHNAEITVRSHPAILDGFVDLYREAYQKLGLFGPEHCVGNRAEQDYIGMVSKLYAKWGITERSNFRRMRPEDYPILSDLYDLIEEEFKRYDPNAHLLYTEKLLQEVLLGLHSMCKGADAQFFNGHTNITSSRFLVFGVKGMLSAAKNVRNAMLFNVLSFMSDKLLTVGNTVAALDELYIWLSNPTAIEYIRNCLKRVRKKESAMLLASQNLEDFDQEGIREMTKPLFSIPPHQFLFNAGSIDKRSYMEMLQLDEAEYNLIKFPQRGVCLYKCGNERYLLEVHAPSYKEKLFGTAGGR